MLGRFGLSGHHHLTPICKLSGGQKARVVFTSISLMQPHILLLDGEILYLIMIQMYVYCTLIVYFEQYLFLVFTQNLCSFSEPTNHLDMQSIDALCDAVEEFEGGVIVISHDAQLLSRLCSDEERSEVLVVEDGMIRQYNGDFEDYRTELIKEIQAELDD